VTIIIIKYILTCPLKGRIAEPEETAIAAIARELLGKHASTVTDTHATIEELLEAMFSVCSAPRLYNEDPRLAEPV
jgi:hypothetical protein